MDPAKIKHIIEACLLVAGREMNIPQLEVLFDIDDEASARPARQDIANALQALQVDYQGRGIELVEVASGWRLQSRSGMEPWVSRLFQEKTPRYSRALLETLVLVAYRQPITRGEIEDVRGVAVSSNIIKTLQEREWVREVGHKDVPGKPALLGTTRKFLDYFNLERLEDLPTLGELKDLDGIDAALAASGIGDVGNAASGDAANDADESGESDVADVSSKSDVAGDAQTAVNPQGAGDESDEAVRLVLPDSHEVDLASFQEIDSGTGTRGDESAPSDAADVMADDLRPTDGVVTGSPIDESTRVDSSNHDSRAFASLSTAVVSGPELDGATVRIDTRVSSSDVPGSASGESDSSDVSAGASTEPYEDPQVRLRRVIDRFAADHRDDLEAQGRPTIPTLPSDELRDPDVESVDADAPDRDDRVP